MVDQKKNKKKEVKKTRAKLTHKLAKYVRARPINLGQGLSADAPNVSHLTLGGAQRKKIRNSSNTWYPADDEKKHFKRTRLAQNKPRGSKIQPGTVVILLSGKHRGRRVVALKNLPSGNLLVSGPFKINGVPLKRINPAYVIKTSTQVSLDGVNVANVDEAFFPKSKSYSKFELKKASAQKKKKIEDAGNKQALQWKNKSRQTQKAVDNALVNNIKKVEQLRGYLGTRFTLYNGIRPHQLKF